MTGLLLGVYRVLLRLLPGGLRSGHASAMVDALRDQLEEVARDGGMAVLSTWSGAIGDLFRRAPYEHWLDRERRQRKERRMMSSLPRDLRYAVRGFGRQPGVTALLLFTLTLGMGAVVAVFALVNGIILRPLPFDEPGRLVDINETAPRWNLEYTGINYPDFDQWRKANQRFEGMALLDGVSVNLADATGSERVFGAMVTHDFASVLRIKPVLGRMFTAAEDVPGGPNVVMIGSNLWRTRFGAALDVVGKRLRINSEPHEIIGVLPPEARFPSDFEFWLPLRGDPTLLGGNQNYSYAGVGRLKPGVAIAEARADLLEAHRPVWAAQDTGRIVSPVVQPLRDRLVADYEVLAGALGVGVVLVLICACTNVASTMLARAIFRQREVAVRMALGADARDVSRLLIVESLVLSLIAGVAGIGLGQFGLRLFVANLPEGLPTWVHVGVDGRTLVAAFAMMVITALIFGLAPALEARRQSARAVLGGATRGSLSASQRRSLSGFVVAEVALATVLLVASGLLIRAYRQVSSTSLGIETENLLTFRVSPPSVRYPDPRAISALYSRLDAGIAALPGVASVALIACPPLDCHNGNFLAAEGEAPRPPGAANPVIRQDVASAGYFETAGLTIVEGRSFFRTDGEPGGARAAIVSEEFVRLKWPDGGSPIGKWVGSPADTASRFTVVGVARDVRQYGLDRPVRPVVYLPLPVGLEGGRTAFAVMVRTKVPPTAMVADIGRVVRSIDPELPMFAIGTMEKAVQESLALRRMLSAVLALFALVALVLAVGGIYAVVSYVAGRRTVELGIRIALGAEQRQVIGLVVRQGIGLVGFGLVVGIPLAMGAARLLSSRLEGLSAFDPVILVSVVAVLAGTGIVAALLPARRAATIDPRVALFSD